MNQAKRCILLVIASAIFILPTYAQTSSDPDIQRLQSRVDDLQDHVSTVTKTVSVQAAQIPPMKDKLDKTAQQAVYLAQDLQTTKATTDKQVSDVKQETNATIQQLQSQIQDLQTKLNTVTTTVTQQGADMVPIKDKLDKTTQATTDLTKATSSLTQDLQTTKATTEKKYSDVKDATSLSINISWTLITGYMVMFMQAGFAMVECGFSRTKNAAHTAMLNFMIYSLGMLGYWVCGFAFQFGGTGADGHVGANGLPVSDLSVSTVGSLGPNVASVLCNELGFHIGTQKYGLLGNSGYFLWGNSYDAGIFTLFLFQMVFMDTTAIIPTGAMAERWKFISFAIYGFMVGAFIYPVFGNWVWGGGWLAAMGANWGLGHGHVDFAGSSVVHVAGGTIAFVGAWMLGPRIGKYNAEGHPNPIPGSNIPLAVLGTFILAFGWFGFNPGSTLSAMDTQIGIIATNTMLASGSGAVTGMIVSWLRIGKPDPSFCCNGMLAGLVAITGPCAFVDAWASIVLGIGAAIVMYCCVFFVEEKLKIDDPAGAISVHGMAGLWGEFCLGIFANGKYGDGWNGVPGKVSGICTWDANGVWTPTYSQIIAEMIGATTCILWIGGSSFVVFYILQKTVGNRVSPEAEIEGLDVPEVGMLGYSNHT